MKEVFRSLCAWSSSGILNGLQKQMPLTAEQKSLQTSLQSRVLSCERQVEKCTGLVKMPLWQQDSEGLLPQQAFSGRTCSYATIVPTGGKAHGS